MKHTVPIKANIHNRFDIEVVRDGKTVQKAYAENIILDALWARMLGSTRTAYFEYIHFGIGTGTLAASRTSLFTFLGAKTPSTAVVSSHGDEGYISCQRSIQLAPEEYVGQTITEVGIGSGSSSSNLVTHAMLRDMNGNPTSIVKTALDVINIYATVYFQYPTAGWYNGGVRMMRVMQDSTSVPPDNIGLNRLANGIFGAALGLGKFNTAAEYGFRFVNSLDKRIAESSASPMVFLLKTPSTFVFDSSSRKVTLGTRLAVGEGNIEPGILSVGVDIPAVIGTYALETAPAWLHVDFTNPTVFAGSTIIGDQIGTGDGVTQDFQTRRVVNSSGATIKIDGNEVLSGVTVDTMKPRTASLMPFIRDIEVAIANNAQLNTVKPIWRERSDNGTSGITGALIFENTLYEQYGIQTLNFNGAAYFDVSTSTDMNTWTLVGTPSGAPIALAIPTEYQKYRYWKVETTPTTGSNAGINTVVECADLVGNLENIHFDTAPAVGAVITADYVTPMVAKDSDHVFDLTLELQFGEYTP